MASKLRMKRPSSVSHQTIQIVTDNAGGMFYFVQSTPESSLNKSSSINADILCSLPPIGHGHASAHGLLIDLPSITLAGQHECECQNCRCPGVHIAYSAVSPRAATNNNSSKVANIEPFLCVRLRRWSTLCRPAPAPAPSSTYTSTHGNSTSDHDR